MHHNSLFSRALSHAGGNKWGPSSDFNAPHGGPANHNAGGPSGFHGGQMGGVPNAGGQDNFGWPGFNNKPSTGMGGAPGGLGRPPPPGLRGAGPGGSWTGSGSGGQHGGWDAPSNMYNQISSCIVLKNLTPQVKMSFECIFGSI
jgi:hypothetical protein